MARFRHHPFAIKAFFNTSVVLTYAIPAGEISRLIPQPFEPDTFRNDWGFIAAAFVETTGLRPSGFPAWTGHRFLLAGYRAFVRYTNKAGHKLRGLYILGSETNSRRMNLLGNFFTNYKYQRSDLSLQYSGPAIKISSPSTGLSVTADSGKTQPPLPAASVFANWKEARRFAGPMPYTFSKANADTVVIVEGVRSHWTPHPLVVRQAIIPFFAGEPYNTGRLSNAFMVNQIPYRWEKGVLEQW